MGDVGNGVQVAVLHKDTHNDETLFGNDISTCAEDTTKVSALKKKGGRRNKKKSIDGSAVPKKYDHGEKAAALFNFDYDGRIWVYNSGLDPAAYGRLSAGVVLSAWAIEEAINRGRQTFDFLRGDEGYKYRFGAKDTTVHELIVSRA